MHNLATVFKFEVIRTVKKKTFWIMSLLFPVLIVAVGGVVYFSNQATSDAVMKSQNQSFSIVITDKSGLIDPKIAATYGAAEVRDKQAGLDLIKSGEFDAYFYYPDDITSKSVEVYGQDVGIFDNGRYDAVASALLSQSVEPQVDISRTAVLRGQVQFASTTYRDGVEYDSIMQLVVPGMFLVLFYILIVTSGNQMLTSTTEEKENRVIEMILTTVRARTLIVGKILSLIVLGLFQSAVVVLPIIIGYILFHDRLHLPAYDLVSIPLDWIRISIAFVLFFVSFMLFTGLLVTIGAATPTAKEAGSFFGAVIMLVFGPLYAAPLFVSSPDSGIVQFLSYFPFTAPIPLLLRNAVGNLELWQAGVAITVLIITTILVLRIAVRVFRYGVLEYGRKLSFKEIFTPRD